MLRVYHIQACRSGLKWCADRCALYGDWHSSDITSCSTLDLRRFCILLDTLIAASVNMCAKWFNYGIQGGVRSILSGGTVDFT
jgi:hypothetical protein